MLQALRDLEDRLEARRIALDDAELYKGEPAWTAADGTQCYYRPGDFNLRMEARRRVRAQAIFGLALLMIFGMQVAQP